MSTINILPPIPIPLKVYRFSNEISQMCFIFGGMKEMEEDVIQLIEDLVKIELTNLVSSYQVQLSSILNKSLVDSLHQELNSISFCYFNI